MTTDSYLKTLYPFLHGGTGATDAERPDAAQVGSGQAALLTLVRHQTTDTVAVLDTFFGTKTEALIDAARAIAGVFRRQGRLFVMGNGVSHGLASQLAVAFQHPPDADQAPLPVSNLGADPGLLTAVASDSGFAHIYQRPLQAHARTGDGLLGLSIDGQEQELLAAFEQAHRIGITSLALTGLDGGPMARSPVIDHCLVVESDQVEHIQVCHLTISHVLRSLVAALPTDDRAAADGEKYGNLTIPPPTP